MMEYLKCIKDLIFIKTSRYTGKSTKQCSMKELGAQCVKNYIHT